MPMIVVALTLKSKSLNTKNKLAATALTILNTKPPSRIAEFALV
jgi:hypothetical protein